MEADPPAFGATAEVNAGPINTVVVGYGYAGERIHVPLVRLAPQLRLYGVVSSDAGKRERIERDLGCFTFAEMDAALDDPEVQLVIIATPNILHASQAVAAMNAGRHVIIDKPMCLTSREADVLLQVARESRVALGVFHNRRFDSDYLTLRRLMQTGQLGDVRWLEMAWQRAKMPRTWRQAAGSGGGRLMDLGSHLIDQAIQLFQAPVKSVYCRMHREYPGLDIDSHAMVTLGFADGRTAIIDTTSLCHAPKPRILALGSKATFVKYGMDPQEAALAAGDIDSAAEPPAAWGTVHTAEGVTAVKPVEGRWRSYYELTGEAIANWPRARLPVPADEAARTIRILEAARASATEGRVVAVDV